MEKMKKYRLILLIIIITLFFTKESYQQTCFYNQMITIFQTATTPSLYQSSGYTFPLTWAVSQPMILNSSFYLLGWKIVTPQKWLSYDASLTSVTSSGATLYFNPSNYSEVLYVQFGVVLLLPCSGVTRLIYHGRLFIIKEHNSTLGPLGATQVISLPVGMTFGPDITNYKTSAILSSFTVPYAGPHYWRLTIDISCKPIVPGNDFHQLTVGVWFQTVSKVGKTYIMLYLPSMVPMPFVYFETYYSYWAPGPEVRIPQIFDAQNQYNCVIGLRSIDTEYLGAAHDLTFTPSASSDLALIYNITKLDIWKFLLDMICTTAGCSNGLVAKAPPNSYTCDNCSVVLPGCSVCATYNLCHSCDPLFALSQPLNKTCVACPTNCLNCTRINSILKCEICKDLFYVNTAFQCSPCFIDCVTCNSSTTCLTCSFGWPVLGGCTNISQCIQVIPNSLLLNKCLKCQSPKIRGAGLCVDTYGCTAANYLVLGTSLVATCTSCNVLLNFDALPISGMCNCKINSTIHKTLKTFCVICPSNCLICEQDSGIAACRQCITNYSPNIPTNTTCYLHPPHCKQISVVMGLANCTRCQDPYFLNASIFYSANMMVCQICLLDCKTCTSDITCQTCIQGGWPVIGGCTKIPHCEQVIKNNFQLAKCIKCTSKYKYKLISGLCVNVTGCSVPKLAVKDAVCLSCDPLRKFMPVPNNNTCLCIAGFSLQPISQQCIEVCGDGTVSNYQCDDGNTDNDDGCSSECKVQDNFACIDGTTTTPSRCIYLRYDIVLGLKKINKIFMENKAVLTFSIQPELTLFKHIDFSTIYKFQTNRSLKIKSASFTNNQIKVEVDFSEDLQTFPASMQITLPTYNFLQKKTKIDFNMISNDMKLIIISDKQKLLFFSQLQEIITITALCVFAAGSLTHKMIGLETLVPIQIIYLSHLLNSDVTPIYSMLSFFANSAFNLLHSQNHLSNIAAGNPSTYSEENEGVTMSVMLLLALSAAVVFCVIVVLRLLTNREDERAKSTKEEQKRLRIVAILSEMGYSHFVFPFLMGTFCVYWPLSVAYEHGKTALGSASLRMGGLQAIALALAFFYEWKEALLQEAGERQSFFKLKRCSRQYVPLFLTYLFVVAVFLCLGFIQIITGELFLATTVSVALISFAVFRPYEDAIHNVGVIYNSAVVAAFSGWNLARKFFPELALEKNEQTAIMAVIGSVAVGLLLATVRIIFHLRGVLSEGLCSELKQAPQKAITADPRKTTVLEVREGDSHQKLLPYHKQYLLKCGLQEESDNIHLQTPVNYFQKNWQKPEKFNSKLQKAKQQLRNYLLRKQASK